MKVKVTQYCSTLCEPMDYSVHGIFQVRILERVDFPFSRRSSQLSNPGTEPSWADSLPAEPPGKPQ